MSTTLSTKKVTLATAAILVAVAGYFFISTSSADALTPLASVQSGDLVRGEATPAVYYIGADGQRYVFPNSNTYFTWYTNFDNVKFLSDTDLGKLKIGGNVTYRPGVTMIKINTDPKTYAVGKDGSLRHVTTEDVAIGLYGNNWNKNVHDMPDSFFGNYTIGTPINSTSEFVPSNETATASTINADKTLQAPAVMSIGGNGYSPIDLTLTPGRSIKFTNNDTINHTVTSDDLSWGTGTIQPGESKIVSFDKAGTFPFFDSYNSQNTGAIYVQ